jgi:hypothetical protein
LSDNAKELMQRLLVATSQFTRLQVVLCELETASLSITGLYNEGDREMDMMVNHAGQHEVPKLSQFLSNDILPEERSV